MARPKFAVQHFVVCTGVSWEGIPGPRVKRTLEGVSYLHTVPPEVESPEFPELWIYARLFTTNDVTGSRSFWVELGRSESGRYHDAFRTWSLGTVEFRAAVGVYNEAWRLPDVRFPVRGDYEFRLLHDKRVGGQVRRTLVARDFIRIGSRT